MVVVVVVIVVIVVRIVVIVVIVVRVELGITFSFVCIIRREWHPQASLAQSVERRSHNPEVVSSILTGSIG